MIENIMKKASSTALATIAFLSVSFNTKLFAQEQNNPEILSITTSQLEDLRKQEFYQKVKNSYKSDINKVIQSQLLNKRSITSDRKFSEIIEKINKRNKTKYYEEITKPTSSDYIHIAKKELSFLLTEDFSTQEHRELIKDYESLIILAKKSAIDSYLNSKEKLEYNTKEVVNEIKNIEQENSLMLLNFCISCSEKDSIPLYSLCIVLEKLALTGNKNYFEKLDKVANSYNYFVKELKKQLDDPEVIKNKHLENFVNTCLDSLYYFLSCTNDFDNKIDFLKKELESSKDQNKKAILSLFLALNNDFQHFDELFKNNKSYEKSTLYLDDMKYNTSEQAVIGMLCAQNFGVNLAVYELGSYENIIKELDKFDSNNYFDSKQLLGYEISDYTYYLKKAPEHNIEKVFNMTPIALIDLVSHLESNRDKTTKLAMVLAPKFDNGGEAGAFRNSISKLSNLIDNGYNVNYVEFSGASDFIASMRKATTEHYNLQKNCKIGIIFTHGNSTSLLAGNPFKVGPLFEWYNEKYISSEDFPLLIKEERNNIFENNADLFLASCLAAADTSKEDLSISAVVSVLFPDTLIHAKSDLVYTDSFNFDFNTSGEVKSFYDDKTNNIFTYKSGRKIKQ